MGKLMANEDVSHLKFFCQEKFTSNTPTIWDVTSLSPSFFTLWLYYHSHLDIISFVLVPFYQLARCHQLFLYSSDQLQLICSFFISLLPVSCIFLCSIFFLNSCFYFLSKAMLNQGNFPSHLWTCSFFVHQLMILHQFPITHHFLLCCWLSLSQVI